MRFVLINTKLQARKMSNQNRFLLPHTTAGGSVVSTAGSSSANTTSTSSTKAGSSSLSHHTVHDDEGSNQHSVDTDFDSYWEEEARNPHRNRIRIGRQYQATVSPLLKSGEKDQRKLEDLETLSFCPKRSAKVSNAELDHYFTVAKSLNLFASLVETRSLLGRDVTIADLNHIRNKEGLSLASVIQPVRQTASSSNISPPSLQQHQNNHSIAGQQSPQKSPSTNCENAVTSPSNGSPKSLSASIENCALNQPLMKALSHFISLHHPCHHDRNCKKLLKDFPLETEPVSAVSITAGNLRQSSSYKEARASKSRAAKQALLLQQQQAKDEPEKSQDHESQENQFVGDNTQVQSPSYEDWTREEVELFSKAIEVCGKNFGSIKKEFLPSKSVRSIVEYYYIGSRDVSEPKRKSNHPVDSSDGCSSPEKLVANNNSQGGGGPSSSSGGKNGSNNQNLNNNPTSSTSASSTSSRNANSKPSNNSKNTISDGVTDISIDSKQTGGQKHVQTKADQDISKSGSGDHRQAKGSNNKSIDVYNFDDEIKEDASSPIRFECPRPGAEVKPLKAKPIVPNASSEADASNSNVGSLKFFMDGQLVLKLNACQEPQGEGNEKCHWVQSGDKVINTNRQKRYSKRANSDHNGSQSNSVLSSNQDDDSKQDDLTGDEDSKESMGSFTQQPPSATATLLKNQSPASKRLKAIKGESNSNKTPSPTSLHQLNQQQQLLQQHHHQQLSQPIDYNRLAVNNRMNQVSQQQHQHSPVINQSAMPWLQANSLAVAAALLGGLPFPQAPPPSLAPPHNNSNNNINATNSIGSNQVTLNNNMSSANASNTKPMDLSSAAPIQKPVQKSTSRSRRPKNGS